MTAAFVSADHNADLKELLTDPIVIDMAAELTSEGVELSTLLYEGSGLPKYWFMTAADADYRRRGGDAGKTLGAVAEAVVMVLAIVGGEEAI